MTYVSYLCNHVTHNQITDELWQFKNNLKIIKTLRRQEPIVYNCVLCKQYLPGVCCPAKGTEADRDSAVFRAHHDPDSQQRPTASELTTPAVESNHLIIHATIITTTAAIVHNAIELVRVNDRVV